MCHLAIVADVQWDNETHLKVVDKIAAGPVANHKTRSRFPAVEGDSPRLLPSPSTPPYQRLTQALQSDPRCAQEVSAAHFNIKYVFNG